MAAEQIGPGDIVYLKSGGPAMTVNWVNANNIPPIAKCQWFYGSELLFGEFNPASLTQGNRASNSRIDCCVVQRLGKPPFSEASIFSDR